MRVSPPILATHPQMTFAPDPRTYVSRLVLPICTQQWQNPNCEVPHSKLSRSHLPLKDPTSERKGRKWIAAPSGSAPRTLPSGHRAPRTWCLVPCVLEYG